MANDTGKSPGRSAKATKSVSKAVTKPVKAAPKRRTAARRPTAASASAAVVPDVDTPVTGGPASKRALRSQGRETMRKLLDAAMEAINERGFHSTRVKDVVDIANTSHGTFYLYFSNKDDLIRALTLRGDVRSLQPPRGGHRRRTGPGHRQLGQSPPVDRRLFGPLVAVCAPVPVVDRPGLHRPDHR